MVTKNSSITQSPKKKWTAMLPRPSLHSQLYNLHIWYIFLPPLADHSISIPNFRIFYYFFHQSINKMAFSRHEIFHRKNTIEIGDIKYFKVAIIKTNNTINIPMVLSSTISTINSLTNTSRKPRISTSLPQPRLGSFIMVQCA
ncbi:hypothetical protein V8G54_012429 [Vigna mungo]|uniref:Uncharacterized protein n=1 Tax=Vigna mungo TaxID=3915 RepID=A0AAQ3NSW2_VIGMU